MIKGIYKNPTANITLNNERLNAFPLKWETREGCLNLLLLFNIVLEVVSGVLQQEIEIKTIQTGKEEEKVSLLVNDILCIKKQPKEATKKLLGLIKKSLPRLQSTRSIYKSQFIQKSKIQCTRNCISSKQKYNWLPKLRILV